MQIEMRRGNLVVSGTNRRSVYSFSYSNSMYLQDQGFEIPEDVREIIARKVNPPLVDLPGYVSKTEPWVIQREALDRALRRKRYAIFMECGTGKTKVAIDFMCFLLQQGLVKHPLVVVPLSIIPTWRREWETHAPLGTLEGARTVPALRKLISKWGECDRKVLILNYEKVPVLKDDLLKAGIDCVIADEVSKVKGYRAKRTKSLAEVSRGAEYCLIMTGTPATHDFVDLFGQYMVMDPFWFGTKITPFRRRYCVMGGWMGSKVVGYTNEDEIREVLGITSISARKKDVLELPEKVYEERVVEMEPEQERLYKKLVKEYLVDIADTKINAKSVLAKISKLQEVSSGFVIADCPECKRTKFVSSGVPCEKCDRKDVHDARECKARKPCPSCHDGTKTIRVSRAKTNAVVEILDELPREAPAVVWCKFREEVDMIREAIGLARPCYILRGGMNEESREREEAEFRRMSPRGAVWIIQIQTGGLGLQLEYVSHTMIVSNTFEALYRFQLEDRFHRPGQKNKVTYYEILSARTIDRYILDTIKSKKDLNEWVLEREGNLAEIIGGASEGGAPKARPHARYIER